MHTAGFKHGRKGHSACLTSMWSPHAVHMFEGEARADSQHKAAHVSLRLRRCAAAVYDVGRPSASLHVNKAHAKHFSLERFTGVIPVHCLNQRKLRLSTQCMCVSGSTADGIAGPQNLRQGLQTSTGLLELAKL